MCLSLNCCVISFLSDITKLKPFIADTSAFRLNLFSASPNHKVLIMTTGVSEQAYDERSKPNNKQTTILNNISLTWKPTIILLDIFQLLCSCWFRKFPWLYFLPTIIIRYCWNSEGNQNINLFLIFLITILAPHHGYNPTYLKCYGC